MDFKNESFLNDMDDIKNEERRLDMGIEVEENKNIKATKIKVIKNKKAKKDKKSTEEKADILNKLILEVTTEKKKLTKVALIFISLILIFSVLFCGIFYSPDIIKSFSLTSVKNEELTKNLSDFPNYFYLNEEVQTSKDEVSKILLDGKNLSVLNCYNSNLKDFDLNSLTKTKIPAKSKIHMQFLAFTNEDKNFQTPLILSIYYYIKDFYLKVEYKDINNSGNNQCTEYAIPQDKLSKFNQAKESAATSENNIKKLISAITWGAYNSQGVLSSFDNLSDNYKYKICAYLINIIFKEGNEYYKLIDSNISFKKDVFYNVFNIVFKDCKIDRQFKDNFINTTADEQYIQFNNADFLQFCDEIKNISKGIFLKKENKVDSTIYSFSTASISEFKNEYFLEMSIKIDASSSNYSNSHLWGFIYNNECSKFTKSIKYNNVFAKGFKANNSFTKEIINEKINPLLKLHSFDSDKYDIEFIDNYIIFSSTYLNENFLKGKILTVDANNFNQVDYKEFPLVENPPEDNPPYLYSYKNSSKNTVIFSYDKIRIFYNLKTKLITQINTDSIIKKLNSEFVKKEENNNGNFYFNESTADGNYILACNDNSESNDFIYILHDMSNNSSVILDKGYRYKLVDNYLVKTSIFSNDFSVENIKTGEVVVTSTLDGINQNNNFEIIGNMLINFTYSNFSAPPKHYNLYNLQTGEKIVLKIPPKMNYPQFLGLLDSNTLVYYNIDYDNNTSLVKININNGESQIIYEKNVFINDVSSISQNFIFYNNKVSVYNTFYEEASKEKINDYFVINLK